MFAFLVRNSLRSRALVLTVAGVLMMVGAFVLPRMPIDVLPDLNKGVVTVLTEAPGLSPEEVETMVTAPLEAMLNGVAGVTRVRTTSSAGLSIVAADFGLGSDPWRTRQSVAERLQTSAASLPPGLQPMMTPMASVMGEIMLVSLSGVDTPAGANADPMELRDLASWVVAPRLRAVPGVSQVIPIGGLVRQVRVTLDADAMIRLDVSPTQVEQAVERFGTNGSAGIVSGNGQDFQIRMMGQPTSRDGQGAGTLEQLRRVVVGVREGVPTPLSAIAEIGWGAMPRVGDASYRAKPAVILSIVKQPGADAVPLTRAVEAALVDLRTSLPPGLNNLNVLFRQADFIEVAVENVGRSLAEAVVVVAIVLLLFLGNLRTTIISLTAIPLSMLVTFVVFNWLGLSINTMTLGGLAIAIGELVDDAVVDVENILRRLRENRGRRIPRRAVDVIVDASQEVRSGIVYSTLIIILVFVPLFAMPGIEGKLFAPLGVAYIVSILASLLTSITVTPVLCSYLLPRMRQLDHGESRFVRMLKRGNAWLVSGAMARPWQVIGGAGFAVFVAFAVVPTLPRSFLPGFNESSLVVVLTMQPGISLDQASRLGTIAERIILTVPEVAAVGRRTGRSEMDEHALGVNETEIEVDITQGKRKLPLVIDDIRRRLAGLPVTVNVEQPISHRLFDHILTGLAAQIVVKVFGPDMDRARGLAQQLEAELQKIDGLTDVGVERQVRVPEIRLRVDGQRAAQYGVTPTELADRVQHMVGGITISRLINGPRRTDIVLRVEDSSRTRLGLADLPIETPRGHAPLSVFATVEIGSTPNQILREDGQRRIAVTANGRAGVDRVAVAGAIQAAIARLSLPAGYAVRFEGTYAEQNDANLRLAGLGLVSLLMIFTVLYARYQSPVLALIVLCNVPLALVGSVIAIKVAHLELSLASMIGFVTLTGISARNGILKVSHCLNLMLHEGEQFGPKLILRACQERMLPVLMTATSASIALVPLLFDAAAPGKELLHPVAVVIFGGLVSSTMLDAVMTPVLLLKFGLRPATRLAVPLASRSVSDAY